MGSALTRRRLGRLACIGLSGGWLVAAVAFAAEMGSVLDPAVDLPVVAVADVVVAGGSTGGVAAAVAAAGAGARVFLATPFPYLGEDVAGTLRLWTEAGEPLTSPLAARLFAPQAEGVSGYERRLPFTYQADRPASGRHTDTDPPGRLADGRWGSASSESVQYDGDVMLTLDLGRPVEVEAVYALIYHERDFQVASVAAAVSRDGAEWETCGETVNPHAPQPTSTEAALPVSVPVARSASRLRLTVQRAAESVRVLLGEVVVIGTAPGPGDLPGSCVVRPLQVKRVLDDALLAAGVPFQFGAYLAEVLRDASGGVRGVVLANRSGRQVVRANALVDATDQAWVARLAGAPFRPFQPTLKPARVSHR